MSKSLFYRNFLSERGYLQSGVIISCLRFMIKRLYNPWHSTREGEREADRQLMFPGKMEDKPVFVIHSLRISSRYHRVQMSGELDKVFLVCSSLTDPKNLFQLFIGASRAKGKVYIFFASCLALEPYKYNSASGAVRLTTPIIRSKIICSFELM
jgi:hypothetical protein